MGSRTACCMDGHVHSLLWHTKTEHWYSGWMCHASLKWHIQLHITACHGMQCTAAHHCIMLLHPFPSLPFLSFILWDRKWWSTDID